jgi:hypothetical protein
MLFIGRLIITRYVHLSTNLVTVEEDNKTTKADVKSSFEAIYKDIM